MNPARVATRVLPLALAAVTCCAVAVQAQTPWPSTAPQQPSGPAWPSAQPAPQQPSGPAWPSAQPATQQPGGPAWPSAQPPGPSAPAPMSMGPAPGGPGMMSGPGPGPGPGPTPEQQKCLQEFTNYRAEVEKRAKAAEAESHKKEKPTREKMCELITGYSTAEFKWVHFAEVNMTRCGIPPQIVEQIKTVHVRTAETKKRVCSAGPTQAGPAATPSLSDALGASLQPDEDEQKKKRKVGGIMDTLTGPVLSR